MRSLFAALLLTLLALPALAQETPPEAAPKEAPKEAPADAPAKVVTFGHHAHSAGDAFQVKRSFDVSMRMKVLGGGQAPQQDISQAMKKVDEREVKVLEAKDGELVKLDVSYVKQLQTRDMNNMGQGGEMEMPLHGMRFEVEDGDGGVQVRRIDKDDKKDKDAEERGMGAFGDPAEEVRKAELATFESRAQSFAAALPKDGKVTVGEAFDFPEAILKGLFEMGNDEFSVKEHTLTLVETRKDGEQELGVFKARFKIEADEQQNGMQQSMTMEGEGEVLIDVATGRFVSSSLKGKFKMSAGGNQGFGMEGKGSLSAEESFTYQPRAEDKPAGDKPAEARPSEVEPAEGKPDAVFDPKKEEPEAAPKGD